MLFKDVIGGEKIKQQLVSGVTRNRIAHAQLFVGSQGSAALPMALAYAQYLNCENKNNQDSCNKCSSCVKFNNISHPDFHVSFPIIKHSKNKNNVSDLFLEKWRNKVLKNPYLSPRDWMLEINSKDKTGKQGGIYKDEALNIQKKLTLKTFESKYRIVLMWMPEKMNADASNKLLKCCEEPPKNTIFILVSIDPNNIMQTVQSRFQKIQVPDFSKNEIREYLKRENVDDKEINKSILSSGSDLGEILKNIYESPDIINPFNHFSLWMRLCYKSDIQGLTSWVDEVSSKGRLYQKEILIYSIRIIRSCLIYNFGTKENEILSEEERRFLINFSPFINEDNIINIVEALENATNYLSRNASSKILFFELSLQMTGNLKVKRKFVEK